MRNRLRTCLGNVLVKSLRRRTGLALLLTAVMTLGAAPDVLAQGSSDDFEAASINSYWSPSQQFGTVQLSSTVSHSGRQSVQMRSTGGGQRELRLQHSFPKTTTGAFSVWFYDSAPGQQTLYAGIAAFDSANPAVSFYVNVADWNPSTYVWSAPGVAERATAVSRTAGWHRFELQIAGTSFDALIDGTVIGSVTGGFSVNTVRLFVSGPDSRPDATFYFDDFRAAPAQGYVDDFESPSVKSFWRPSQQFGTVQLSAAVSHSGRQSVQMKSTDGGQRWIWLQHSFPQPTTGAFSVWFYDSAPGQQTLYAGIAAFDSTNPAVSFYVNVADWNQSTYVWSAPGVAERATAVSRTAGWHRFELQIAGTSFDALIDGTVVGSVTGSFSINTVRLFVSGPDWRPNATFYFDDFTAPTSDGLPDSVAVDFGRANGLWLTRSNASQWSKLHGLSPTHMAVGDVDGNGSTDLIVDFPGYGVWIWSDNSRWIQLHPFDVTDIAVGDLDGNGRADVIVSFPGYGTYAWMNNATWVQLGGLAAERMATGNLDNDAGHRDELIASFPGAGVWVWRNNSAWVQLHTLNPTHLTTGDFDGNGLADVVLDLPGIGVWTYMNNAAWARLLTVNTLSIATGNLDGDAASRSEVVLSVAGAGIWALLNNTVWVQLNPVNATQLITADLDGNGRADVVANFPGAGIWAWMNNTSWIQLHPLNAEDMTAGPIDN